MTKLGRNPFEKQKPKVSTPTRPPLDQSTPSLGAKVGAYVVLGGLVAIAYGMTKIKLPLTKPLKTPPERA